MKKALYFVSISFLLLFFSGCFKGGEKVLQFTESVVYTENEEIALDIQFKNIAFTSITFTSSDEDVATVNENAVYRNKLGVTTITANYNDVIMSSVDVYFIPSIKDITIKDYMSYDVKVENGEASDFNFVTDSDIISIDGKTISCLKEGTATVTAILKENENVKNDFVVTVLAKKIEVMIRDYVFLNTTSGFSINFPLEEINIEYDTSVIRIEEGNIYPQQIGSTDISFTHKTDNTNTYTVAFIVYDNLPIINIKNDDLVVGDFSELYLENYSNNDDFIWQLSNDETIILYEDYWLDAIGFGSVKVTVSHKDNPLLTSNFTIYVGYPEVSYSISNKCIKVDDEFVVNLNNYQSNDEFNIEYDEEYLEYIENTFKAIKDGKTIITYTLKEDETITFTEEITIYSKTPVISMNDKVTIGKTVRIDVLNYPDINDIIIEAEKGSLKGNLYTGLDVGTWQIKIIVKENKELYSTINIDVLPIMPKLRLTTENIILSNVSYLSIENISDLEYKSIEDYDYNVDDESIVKLEINDVESLSNVLKITALNIGSTIIRVVAKDNPNINSFIYVNVYNSEVELGTNNEPIGPLLLYMEDQTCNIEAGLMTKVFINGANDYNKYLLNSSNTSVVTVGDNGRVIAINAGAATITVCLKENNDIIGRLNVTVYGLPNVDYVSRLISIATEELGYIEGYDNDTKYGEWYGLNGEAWCAMFVSWCAFQAGVSTDVIPRYCGCLAGSEWFINNDSFGYKEEYVPKAGDIIFFLSDGASHTGIVTHCDGETVYTIEGNTSSMVARRSYALMHNTITGYGIPNYPEYKAN